MRFFLFTDSLSFRSPNSEELAQIYIQGDQSIRQKFNELGLTLNFDTSKPRLNHDGRCVGIDGFEYKNETYTVAVAPKEGSLALTKLLEALRGRIPSQVIKIKNIANETNAWSGQGNFAPAFLSSLLSKITSACEQLLGATRSTRQQVINAGIKGRPNLRQTVRLWSRGYTTSYVCELPDPLALQNYAEFLWATAKDIKGFLDSWSMLTQDFRVSVARIKYLTSPFMVGQLSEARATQLAARLVRPPYPFGLQDVIAECFNYWKFRSTIDLASSKWINFAYRPLIIQLNELFEEYVGLTFARSLGSDWQWHRTFELTYKTRIIGPTDRENKRSIELDHLFMNEREDKPHILVDAKYSSTIAREENIYQICAYLDRVDYEYGNSKPAIGILSYPGSEFEQGVIEGFGHKLFWVRLPIIVDFSFTNALFSN